MCAPKIILAILLFAGTARAQDPVLSWQVNGRVVDEQGTPVEDYEVSTFWFANGNWWDERGELLEDAKAGKLWTNEGDLAASPKNVAKRLSRGRFTLPIEGLSNVEIAAMLRLSVPVVKTRVHRARLFLRKQLGDVMTMLDAPMGTGGWS